jgi:hypothetical protein
VDTREFNCHAPIGSGINATAGTGGPVYSCANDLNQYEFTDDQPGTCPAPGTSSEAFQYDHDGNLHDVQNNAVLRKYTWGLDLSGQNGTSTVAGLHGAGGIGVLLAVVETGGSHAGTDSAIGR